jgi:predicted ATP-grasp superfamily ATP-dependent carboligase
MRVLVYEHLCSRDAHQLAPADQSLTAEGRAMLQAVLADLARCPGVEPAVLLHPSHLRAFQLPPEVAVHFIDQGGEEVAFRTLAASCEFALVIAPEFDEVLLVRGEWACAASARLLGPGPELIRLTADKLALAEHLLRHGLPTPPTLPLSEPLPGWPYPVVVKPRHGAGSLATFLIHDEGELHDAPSRARAEGWFGELIVQPFLPGQPVSKSVLAGPAGLELLPGCRQALSEEGRFRYLGGSLPLPDDLDERAGDLVLAATRVLPGLSGYAGFDLVLGERGDWLIEVNPRITTSYVGLRALAKFNLAEALLAAVRGSILPALEWESGPIRFSADGACQRVSLLHPGESP